MRRVIKDPVTQNARLTRALLTCFHPKFGYIARQWQSTQGADSPKRAASRALFAQAVALVKQLPGDEIVAARQIVGNTPFTWRDVVTSAVYGKFVIGTLQGGQQVIGLRIMQSNAQQVLDAITNTPGSILVRLDDGWYGLDPGTAGQVLTLDTSTGLPAWITPGGSGGGSITVENPQATIGDVDTLNMPTSVLSDDGSGQASLAFKQWTFTQAGPTYSTAAFATKGVLLLPLFDTVVHRVAVPVSATSGHVYQCTLVTLTGSTTTQTIGTVLGSVQMTAPSTANQTLTFDFSSSPITMAGGTRHGILITDTSASTTTTSIGLLTVDETLAWNSFQGIPCDRSNENTGDACLGFLELASKNPTSGQSCTASNTSPGYAMAVEFSL